MTDALDTFNAEWGNCTACELSTARAAVTRPLVVGDIAACQALVVLAAPSRRDEAEQLAITGAEAVALHTMLEPSGIANYVAVALTSCRPASGFALSGVHFAACSMRVDQLRSILSPRLVVSANAQFAPYVKSDATIACPRALLKAGHPTAATLKQVSVSVAKLKRAAERAGVASLSTANSTSNVVDVCAHDMRAWAFASKAGKVLKLYTCIVCGFTEAT